MTPHRLTVAPPPVFGPDVRVRHLDVVGLLARLDALDVTAATLASGIHDMRVHLTEATDR